LRYYNVTRATKKGVKINKYNMILLIPIDKLYCTIVRWLKIMENRGKVKTETNKKNYAHISYNILSVLAGINLAENGNAVCVLSR